MDGKKFTSLILILVGWVLLYLNLQYIANFIVDNIFGLEKGKHLTESIRFFIFELLLNFYLCNFL